MISPNRIAGFTLLVAAVALLFGGEVNAAERPTWKSIEGVVSRYFRALPDYKDGDLISRGHVNQLLGHLAKMGWRPADRNQIVKDTLEDNNVVVQSLSGNKGQTFMRKVNRDPLIYSRLDRLSQKRGGPALIRDVVKLPDGAKYASTTRTPGVPTLIELLPKVKRSKPQSVRDYDKATGKIYTSKQLLTRLKESYDKESKP